MENQQRVCVLYTHKHKPEDYNDPHLKCLFLVFPKLKTIEEIKELCKKSKIKFEYD